jgi:hypothetical protein
MYAAASCRISSTKAVAASVAPAMPIAVQYAGLAIGST